MKKLRKKIICVSGLMIALLLIGMSIPVVGPMEDPPYVQQHFGTKGGKDLPLSENIGEAWFVSPDGDNSFGISWETAFNSIQKAVDFAIDGRGDYIYVRHGIYYENVEITKSNLHLIGENPWGELLGENYWTKVDSISIMYEHQPDDYIENVEIAGFNIGTIEIDFGSASNINTRGIYIHDNVFTESMLGIYVHNNGDFSNFLVISNNYFYDCYAGIMMQGGAPHESEISNNVFTDCFHGIEIDFIFRCSIVDNQFFDLVDEGIGIVLWGGYDNLIAGNYFGVQEATTYSGIPIIDEGFGNNYVDNHWSNWHGYIHFDISVFDGNEHFIVEPANAPSEGKITVRLVTSYPGDIFSEGDTVTYRLRNSDGAGYVLDSYIYTHEPGKEESAVQLEATMRGGEEFIVTVQVDTEGSGETWYCLWYILDA